MSEAPTTEPGAVPEVAASEADLIELTRALVAPEPGDLWALLAGARPMASHISVACARLVAEALRQLWPALWRRGAAPGARPWTGEPAALACGAPTFALLRWLVETPLGTAAAAPRSATLRAATPLALGDQVVIYLALAAADGTPAQAAIAAQPMVRAAPLAWLGFAELVTGAPPPQAAFDALARGAGAKVVEALAPELARRWRTAELAKRGATDPAQLIAVGAAQDAALDAWFTATARQRALAGFVLDAAAPSLARGLPPEPGKLDRNAPLGVRAAARVAAGALLRGVGRWAAWDHEHRGVRFIDDDYADAQRLLARFEAIGSAGAELAARWLAELAALPAVPGTAA